MATINDNLIQLAETKSLIKDAIKNKGVDVPDDLPFLNYPEKINQISGGGDIDKNIVNAKLDNIIGEVL